MKLQIDIKNYKVGYIGFQSPFEVRQYLKNMLPLDYVNIDIKEGIDTDRWNYFFNVKANEKKSNFWFSGKVGVVLFDHPAIVSTFKARFYNINIVK